MATQAGIERYIPNGEVDFPQGVVGSTTLEINGQAIPHFQTLDFPVPDPWSLNKRRVLSIIRREGSFRGRSIVEIGIGDGRNEREVGDDIREVVGIDIELWRLQVAGVNLVTGPAKLHAPIELWKGDGVEWLQNLRQATGRERLSGWVIICLPQSPEGLNAADRYDGSLTLNSYRTDWDKYGLTLNAATLDSLRAVAAYDLRVSVTLSDRVPEEARTRMIRQTGWEAERPFSTPEPIQQDPDTGIQWVSRIDDGQRFYEFVATGQYSPISAIEAERRRLASLASGQGRDELNVYHHLYVYQLRPR